MGSGDTDLSATLMQVSVELLNDEGVSVEQKILEVAGSATSGNTLKSTGPVALEGAKRLVVNVSHPGYTSFSRRVEASPVVYLNAELLAVEELTVNMTQTESVSGATVDGFTVNLPTEGNEGDLQVGIPRSLLPEGTTSVTAELKSFDPNDPVDAQNFPGAYADTDGNNLVSVAFNYASIRTDSGETLASILQARAAQVGIFSTADAEEPVIINRGIPASSCVTLSRLGDSDAETTGFQIPVYSYDNSRGLWELLGHGTVYTSAGALINAVDENACEDGSYVLEIAVTSEIFLSEWWNLDYPLVFSEPVKYCAQIKLQNETGETLNGVHGFYYGEAGEFASNYFVTDNNGNALLEVDTGTSAETINANILFFGENIQNGTVILSRNCSNPQPQIVEVRQPRLCQIKGQLEYPDGSAATRHPILAVPTNYALGDYIDFTGSNSAGEYWLNATCEKDYAVTIIWTGEEEVTKQANVNGTVSNDETADNGTVATLPTIEIEPIPTEIAGVGYSTADKRIYLFTFGHRDYFPLNYDLRIANENGQQIGTLAGTASLSSEVAEEYPWYFGYSEIISDIDINVGDDSFIQVTGTVVDSRNQTKNIDILVPVTNEPLGSIFDD